MPGPTSKHEIVRFGEQTPVLKGALLTPEGELAEKFLTLIRQGVCVHTACKYVGLKPATFADWMRRAETHGGFYEDFKLRFQQAEAGYEVTCQLVINDNMNSKDAKWMLERKNPQQYGRPAPLPTDSTGPDQALQELAEERKRLAILNKVIQALPEARAMAAEAFRAAARDEVYDDEEDS